MNRASAVNSKQRDDRRGAVVGLLLIALVFLTGFFALCLNIVRLQNIQAQLQAACRSAALAGATELLDEGCLYGRREPGDDVYAARSAACFFAGRNHVDGRPIKLDANAVNLPEGDVVVGWVDPAGPVGQILQTTSQDGSLEPNTVRVTMHLGRNVADRMTARLGAMVGLKEFDIGARAQATIDRRICGFRPRPGVRVPLLPMIAEYENWIAEAQKPATDQNDKFIVDPLTGAVTAGSDGVAEMKLVCGPQKQQKPQSTTAAATPTGDDTQTDDADTTNPSSTTVACAPLVLFNPDGIPTNDALRCREGLSADDLGLYGRELVLRGGILPVFAEPTLTNDLAYALMDVVGQPRAWALGEHGSSSADQWTVVGFAAARIVAVRAVQKTTGTEWEIFVQPTTLVCSQAVASSDMNPNPWLAKLELTQ